MINDLSFFLTLLRTYIVFNELISFVGWDGRDTTRNED